jgi:CheY-like chemotaxis protein
MSKRSVLVVDDNPTNLKLLQFLLKSQGYDVQSAGDAERAQAQLRRSLPDLILMDIQLPGLDGLALTKQLKADASTQRIPIVAVTAYAMKGDEKRAREAGVDGYLTKPIRKRQLIEAVETALASSRSNLKLMQGSK